ncbi:chemotaxis protein CheA [Opitutus sp. ER46]|uniref:chemotaxis protein CheA n=1 Tax=Opitutus sp. ER46 TaxID=2161864 RepID=UPI000D3102C5|nr:chemotaxis protein CheA [Opitutus sp. ER46]PTX91191.1 chemotaxis protein CheA [Opitutus sp. ER46]
MTSDANESLRAELLDDFYAECDEQLSNVRLQLTGLEHAAAAGRADATALESCFRSMHSLKGNAALAGLRPAEQLAHAIEERLRQHVRHPAPLPATATEPLAFAAQRLEQLVAAHRLQQSLPPIDDALTRLNNTAATPVPDVAAHVPAVPAPEVSHSSPPPASPAHWRFSFAPSPELDRRGVNVSQVRARLTALGEITNAVPVIQPGGAMRFDFTVAAHTNPGAPDIWLADGVTVSPAPTEAVASAPAPPPAPTSASLFVAPSHLVRVDLSRLDELMRITGEMVIHRSRLEERIGRLPGNRPPLQEVNLALARSLRELRDALTRVRLVPIAEIFTRLPFVVRDLARDSGKTAQLAIEGQHTEIDKFLVERLKEPLLHLVRNAVTHGLESPAERRAVGKPETGTITLSAEAASHSVLIRVRDDGRGIDTARVAARAAAAGLVVPEPLDAHTLLGLLCQPGFSTRDEADRAAGRGVGMAVVQSTVRELGGNLALTTSPAGGTQFSLRLPLTLSIAETFVVTAGDHTCAVPQDAVHEVIALASEQIRFVNRFEVVPHADDVLPLLRLRQVFGLPRGEHASAPTLVLHTDHGRIGLVVDRVLGRREVVVRAMQDPLIQVPGISGATELGDGRPVLILDPHELAATARCARPSAAPSFAS